jgi:hypothetical protein
MPHFSLQSLRLSRTARIINVEHPDERMLIYSEAGKNGLIKSPNIKFNDGYVVGPSVQLVW